MPVPDKPVAVDRRLMRDEAYAALRDAIVAGVLQPGERLRDADLCAWLGVSRTPVREALGRLEAIGLVESSPQRWTRVAPLDRRDARDAFPVVAAVHALAAETAVQRLTPTEFAAMRAANDRLAASVDAGNVDAALAADDEFHGVFVAAASNAEITRTLDRLMPKLRRLERLQFSSLGGRWSVHEHRRIVELAERRHAEATAQAVRSNWLTLGTLLDASLQKEPA